MRPTESTYFYLDKVSGAVWGARVFYPDEMFILRSEALLYDEYIEILQEFRKLSRDLERLG